MGGEVIHIGAAELVLRLFLATLIGALLGFDRELKGHAAGIRTHGLVALSSAVIMLSALLLFDRLRGEHGAPDPLRAIQGLAQAIGFIAAGLIFVKQGDVRNMTSAANIWLAAAIGIACGAGQYLLTLIAAGFGLVLLIAVRWMERRLPHEEPGADEE